MGWVGRFGMLVGVCAMMGGGHRSDEAVVKVRCFRHKVGHLPI